MVINENVGVCGNLVKKNYCLIQDFVKKKSSVDTKRGHSVIKKHGKTEQIPLVKYMVFKKFAAQRFWECLFN